MGNLEMEEIKQQMMMIYEVMGSNEFAEAVSSVLWNIYQKCKSKGFTDEQALSITLQFSKSQNK